MSSRGNKRQRAGNHSYRDNGLVLLTTASTLWNTVYLERAIESLKRKRGRIDDFLLEYLSPLS
ncbi:Tn3 family transposase [Photorhabdus heterorhabditis]|uniref:Tn3 family transposase n=1 Tax=Photorhabdus heterorhabditis TaxID=880156 RepID=A0A5B0XBF7_9GAMM|nr:Tn3 family transposase [Photorhabdus heterorhabditis]